MPSASGSQPPEDALAPLQTEKQPGTLTHENHLGASPMSKYTDIFKNRDGKRMLSGREARDKPSAH